MTNLITSRRLWLGFAGSALFLGLFFWRTDLSELGDALADADYRWVVPAVALWFVSAAVRSLRWHYLLRRLAGLRTVTLYPIVVIGYMANNLLPLRTGEFVRAYVLGERHGVSKMSALGTIAVERVFDGVVLVGSLLAAGAILGLNEELTALAVVMSVAFAALLGLFVYVASSPERARRWTERAIGVLPGAVRQAAQGLAGDPQTVGVIGGGVAGLTAAYRLLQKGYRIHLFEAGPQLGGLVRTFEIGGEPGGCFYHPPFTTDTAAV